MDIILKNINKSYGEKEVLKNLNLTINNGTITFIMGESGVGKTSLLKILLNLDKEFSGEIYGLKDKKISAVFQENRLCEELTIKRNLKLINEKIYDKEIEDALKSIGIKGSLNTKIKELSGGMKRRIAILRALLVEFHILILDEPFKGLDEENKEKTINFIQDRIEGKTVIIVTHDKREKEFFKNVICLDLGKELYRY